MNKKIWSSLDILYSELDVLREHELHNVLGGTGSSGSSFGDIWDRLANGDLSNIPSGKYDFNTGTFTPLDSTMTNAA